MAKVSGKEKLVLSGGVDNELFWEHVIDVAGVEKPRIVMDTVAAPNENCRRDIENTAQHLRDFFGAKVMLLNPIDDKGKRTSPGFGAEQIALANILYASPGDTYALLAEWHGTGRFRQIEPRMRAGNILLAGAGAGSLIWSERGFSDYKQYRTPAGRPWEYTTLPGLGLLPGWANVHHSDRDNLGRFRKTYMELRYVKAKDGSSAFGLDYYAGVRLADGKLTALDLLSETMPQDSTHAVYHYENNSLRTRQIIQPGEVVPL